MARVPWLADVLRDAGVTVIEHKDWKTHVRPGSWDPRYIVVHATAAPRTQSDTTQVGVVRKGRPDLRGPIANACVDRDGRWHVISAGRCNTTKVGTAGPFDGLGNTNALGIEACNDNGLDSPPEAWPDVQYNAYVRGVAAICKRLDLSASDVVGHKEHTPRRKHDPTFDMNTFRADVTQALTGARGTLFGELEEDMPTVEEIWNAKISPAGATMTVALALAQARNAAVAAQTAVTTTAKAEALRDAAQDAKIAQLLTIVETLSRATRALTPDQVATLKSTMESAAQQAGNEAAARIENKLDVLRQDLVDGGLVPTP